MRGIRRGITRSDADNMASGLVRRPADPMAGYVGVLQRALVPEVPQAIGDLSISAAYSPAEGRVGGGAFYDVFELSDGRVAVLVGDVAGHGRGALERATVARYTVRAFVEAGLGPRLALKDAGDALGEACRDGFVTAAVAVLDPAGASLTYALAGHPPPLLLGAGLKEPAGAGPSPPLGLGVPTGLRQTSLSLSAGAVACFFTDGLIEAHARQGALREHFERLLVMLGPRETSARLLLRSLRETAARAEDDMAVCLLRPGGEAARAPLHVEELELGPGGDRGREAASFLAACGVRDPGAVRRARKTSSASPLLIRVEHRRRGSSVEVRARHSGSRRLRFALPGRTSSEPTVRLTHSNRDLGGRLRGEG